MARRIPTVLVLVLALAACGSPPSSLPLPPPLAFVDISSLSPDLAAAPFGGHDSWSGSDKFAPGVALVDLDGDGALDLVQPRNDRSRPELRSLHLYRGLGNGSFVDNTTVEWSAERNATVSLAFDYDGDDDLDLFIGVDGGPSALYRNDGDWSFVDVAQASGVAAPGARVFAAAAADIDGDHDLDLYLGTWNASAPEHGPGTAPNLMLENRGDGTFVDITEASGTGCRGDSTLGLAFADLDGDRDQDLFVANDFFPACLYENLGDGRFREVAEAAGVAGGALNGMGVAVGDLDGDGRLDLLVTDDEVVDESRGNAVYLGRAGEPLGFDSRGLELGLDGVQTLQADWLVCWGAGLVDFDLDGDLDVHVTTHGLRSELVWQQTAAGFEPELALMATMDDVDGRGSAYGDIDGDDDLDIVIARRGAGLQVLRNSSVTGAHLTVDIRPRYRAIGATIEVATAGRARLATIQAGSSYMATSPPLATVGLADASIAERVTVALPDGTIIERTDVPAGTLRIDL